MRLRAALAAVITVLLLAIPCATSTCEMSCALQAQGCHAHAAVAVDAQQATGAMRDCGMRGADAMTAAGCRHVVSVQQVMPGEEQAATLAKPSLQVPGLTLPVPEYGGIRVAERPALRPSLLASFQSCIRV